MTIAAIPVAVPIQRLPHSEGLPLPKYQTPGSAGVDLLAAVAEAVTLPPGGRALIPTGIAVALPQGYEAQVRPRSGLALKQGLTVLNAPGTIDSDYRGEVGVILANLEPDATVARRHSVRRWWCAGHPHRLAIHGVACQTERARGFAPPTNERTPSKKPCPIERSTSPTTPAEPGRARNHRPQNPPPIWSKPCNPGPPTSWSRARTARRYRRARNAADSVRHRRVVRSPNRSRPPNDMPLRHRPQGDPAIGTSQTPDGAARPLSMTPCAAAPTMSRSLQGARTPCLHI
jgi:dUTP pyrophosphatase